MDVAAPKSPAPALNPFARPAESSTQSGAVPVRPAPLSSVTAAPAPRPMTMPPATVAINAHRPGAKKMAMPAQPARRTPVALITVTVFVMLVLSVLAVTVYMTSKTA